MKIQGKKTINNKEEMNKTLFKDKEREISIKIISEFEDLLALHNIQIPSSEREGEESEACIYGANYYNLEDKITEILKEFKK